MSKSKTNLGNNHKTDIRSYFFKDSGSSKLKTGPNPVQSKKRNRRVIESDDEDEDLIVSKKKTKEQSCVSQSKKEVTIQVENFFGSKPVQQKKQTVVTKKPVEKEETSTSKKVRKNEKKKENKVKNVVELSFENDDELEASLLQTDDEQLLSSEKNEKNRMLDGKTIETKDKNSSKKEPKEKIRTPKKNDGKRTPKKEISVNLKEIQTPKQTDEKPDSSLIISEQKRRNAEAYQKYLNRSGPKNPGSKIIPEGTSTCLQGLIFVITGVLDSLERDEATELIQKCGGRVTGSVSKKTDYVVVGEEPGISKIQKAENFGTKKINEDELLNLIREKSGGDKSGENGAGREKSSFVKDALEKTSKYFDKESSKKRARKMEEVKDGPSTPKKFNSEEKKNKSEAKKRPELEVEKAKESFGNFSSGIEKADNKDLSKTSGDMLWVDKYRPKSIKNIIGQMGEKSNMKKLIKWLENWHKNHSQKKEKKLARPAPWAQNDDGSYYKAALLSGPPGVGKTTTVNLVCEELGLDIIEFNASDTRSKRLLQEEVSELLSTKSIRGFLQGSGENYQKHVLVMDEVDGMAGNEDRGGIQELIQLIKNTKVPIVGICNDRSHPKMRSLVNYCFDLRFQRPRIEQIKGAMKSICFKEKLDISNEALEELIVASNHDIRQVLHNLSLLASGHKALTYDEVKKKSEQAKKPLNLSPWDVVRKVFSSTEQENMTFANKTDLFFQDYSMGPLFVQDTYLRVKPYKAQNNVKKRLELISKAADSLALGDLVEKAIRSQNTWSLLPVQAVFSSVLPGHYMSGHIQGVIQFPVWLGKNSRTKKFERLLQDLHYSLRISITGSKESLNLDYLNHLKNTIIKPLIEEGSEGVQKSLQFMLNYHLMKEDLDNILELSSWPGVKDTFSEVDSKVKAALTRALNKEGQMVVSAKKNAALKGDADNVYGEQGEEEFEETESDSIDLDPMIKIGKPKIKKEKGQVKEEKKKERVKKDTKKRK